MIIIVAGRVKCPVSTSQLWSDLKRGSCVKTKKKTVRRTRASCTGRWLHQKGKDKKIMYKNKTICIAEPQRNRSTRWKNIKHNTILYRIGIYIIVFFFRARSRWFVTEFMGTTAANLRKKHNDINNIIIIKKYLFFYTVDLCSALSDIMEIFPFYGSKNTNDTNFAVVRRGRENRFFPSFILFYSTLHLYVLYSIDKRR